MFLIGRRSHGGEHIRIAIFHGWELTGSGSNEYTRYLARALSGLGHEVHVLCREPEPVSLEIAGRVSWRDAQGTCVRREDLKPLRDGACHIHILPHDDVHPVFICDKQRAGVVKSFSDLSDGELTSYRALAARVVEAVLRDHPVDIVHANHVLLQPSIAMDACAALSIPFVIYPHGSGIEYTLRSEARYQHIAREALLAAAGLIVGSDEMLSRLVDLYPQDRAALTAKSATVGVGVDTGLFEPVRPDERRPNIHRMLELARCAGKTAALESELQQRLSSGDFSAVRAYRDTYDHDMPDADLVRKAEAIPWDTGKILLFVGSLTAGKGLHGLITALSSILQDHPDTHLVIIGSGSYREALEALVYAISNSDAPCLDALIADGYAMDDTHLRGSWTDVAAFTNRTSARAKLFAEGRKLSERVHFLGRLPHELLRFVFPCADLAVFPSVVPEAYPLVMMEALASGVMPVASDFGGVSAFFDELQRDLPNETLESVRLPVEDSQRVEGMVERLTRALSLSPMTDLHELAEKRYDWRVRAQQMAQTYGRWLV